MTDAEWRWCSTTVYSWSSSTCDMTESEWLAGNSRLKMLQFVCEDVSERKLRLFACACSRHLLPLMPDKRGQQGVEVAERFADGEATELDRRKEWEISRGTHGDHSAWALHRDALEAALGTVQYLASAAARTVKGSLRAATRLAERKLQATLLRDIVGNPFRPMSVNSNWKDWNDRTIPKIAQRCYEERTFAHLPILADALEDAGCDDADILAHCRGPGPHVRGCWVVDLILGKK